MGMRVHNLKAGNRVWLGDRDADPERWQGLFDGGEWRWWNVVECTEQPNGVEYHLVMKDDAGNVFDHIVSSDLGICAQEADGEYL